MGGREGDFYLQMGHRIAARRHDLGMTQQQLAMGVGLSRTSITNIEAGRQNVVAHSIVMIAEQLGMTSDELLGVTARRKGPRDEASVPGLRGNEAAMVQRALVGTREEAHAQESSDPKIGGGATRSGRSNQTTGTR